MVSRPLMQRRLSRRSIFHRDGYKCQYCGLETRTLTLDHIIPRSRGGAHSWQNVVSALHSLQPPQGRPAAVRCQDEARTAAGDPAPRPLRTLPPQGAPGRVAPVHTLGRLAGHGPAVVHYDERLGAPLRSGVEHLGRRDRHLRIVQPLGRVYDDPFSDLQVAFTGVEVPGYGPVV